MKIADELLKIAEEVSGITVVEARDEMPEKVVRSVFLAGPISREEETQDWREGIILELMEAGFEGVVYNPVADDYEGKYDEQVAWEQQMLNAADCILFWVPRDMETMPALTTNVEFGTFYKSGKVVLAYPEKAPSMDYLATLYEQEYQEKPCHTLKEAAKRVVEMTQEGAEREGGERFVPLLVWNTQQFQGWYDSLINAGNRLDEVKVLWLFKMPKMRTVFSYVIWVKVWIEEEQRWKENEWVFSRTDIVTTVLIKENNKEVMLVREYRSPSRTEDGFVRELPGGTLELGREAEEMAVEELREESDLDISKSRLTLVGTRQVAGTLCSYTSTVFRCNVTDKEWEKIKIKAESGESYGKEEDTEMTYIEVVKVLDLLRGKVECDWATLGMICSSIVNFLEKDDKNS